MINQTIPVYGSLHEQILRSPRALMDEKDRLDQAALEVHLDRLGDAALLRVGFTNAIFDRRVVRLDPNDPTAAAQIRDGKPMIPAPFLRQYFREPLKPTSDGTVDLTALCEEKKVAYFFDSETGLIAITPDSVLPVTASGDRELIRRMALVFEDDRMPFAKYNSSGETRTVIERADFPCGNQDFRTKPYTCLYSPAIAVTRAADGHKVLFVSHEYNQVMNWQELSAQTSVKRSDDDGKTWREIVRIDDLRWAHLFEAEGRLYLIGNKVTDNAVAVVCIGIEEPCDVGSGTVTYRQTVLPYRSSCQANAGVISGNRLFVPAFPLILSADIRSDLMEPAGWTASNPMSDLLTRDWLLKAANLEEAPDFRALEPNIVETPAGELYVIMRLEMQPYNGFAGLLRLSPDGKQLSPVPECNSIVKMPTSVSKFCVRYDRRSGLYLSMPNFPSLRTPLKNRGAPLAGQRNVLCLAASPDLIHWKMIDILLSDREVMNPVYSAKCHAFQYVVWEFDGNDLVYVVREAAGYTNQFHDGNFTTMYRLKNYEKLLRQRYDKTDFYQK